MKPDFVLCVDVGNTRLKWGVCDFSDLSFVTKGVFDYLSAEIDKKLSESLVALNVMPVYISSVSADKQTEIVSRWFENNWKIKSNIIRFDAFYQQLNAYETPSDLGVDRWLAMVAAQKKYQSNFCVIDAGTAITIDVVDVNAKHLGGVIMPGKAMMLVSLNAGAANIKQASGKVTELADNTADGVISGVEACVIGGIEKKLTSISRANSGIIFILTGGDAENIAQSIDLEFVVESNLVLEGVGLVARDSYA